MNFSVTLRVRPEVWSHIAARGTQRHKVNNEVAIEKDRNGPRRGTACLPVRCQPTSVKAIRDTSYRRTAGYMASPTIVCPGDPALLPYAK